MAPMFPLPGRAQRGPTIPRARPWRLSTRQREIHPQGSAAFRRRGAKGVIIPRPRSSIPHRLSRALCRQGQALPAVPGSCLLWEGIGKHGGLHPNKSAPSPPESELRTRGLRTPLANTPPRAERVLKPAEPATGPGQWGNLQQWRPASGNN